MKHWSQLKERGSYAGIALLAGLYRIGERPLFRVVLYPVLLYFFFSNRVARQASLQFLQRAYASGSPALPCQPGLRISFRHFVEFGETTLDKLAAWMGRIDERDIDFPEQAQLHDIISSGRGALLIGSHLGNLELTRALAELNGKARVQAVVFTEQAQNFQRMLKAINPAVNCNLIEVSDFGPDTAIGLRSRIDAGELLVIVGDRTPVHSQGRTIAADFLGRPAPFSIGPFIIASLLECPVLLFFCLRRNKRFHVYLEPFAAQVILPRANRQQALQSYVDRYAQRLGYYACLAPLQWFNFFDFWQIQSHKSEP